MAQPPSPRWAMWLGALVTVVILGGLGLAAWHLGPAALRFVRALQPEVAVSLVVGVLTVAALLWRRGSEVREGRRVHVRDQKIPVYETFLRFWFKLLYEGAKGKRQSTRETLNKFVVESVPGFIFWASPAVIRSWNELRHRMATAGPEEAADATRLLELEDLMLTMRADVGQDNTGLERGDLLRLFLNNPETILGQQQDP